MTTNSQNASVNIERLDRYFSGDADTSDHEAIAQWCAARAEHRALIDARGSLVPRGRTVLDRSRMERMLHRIHVESGVGPMSRPAASVSESPPTSSLLRRWVGVASMKTGSVALFVVTLVLVAAGVATLRGREHVGRAASTMGSNEFKTMRGQRTTLTLPDGSHVTLGANSRLSYPVGFGTVRRDVTLVGEAYFEVVHSQAQPFVVHAGDARTTVLGTSFSVRKYPEDSTLRVVVASGRVALDRVILDAGDMGLRSIRGVQVQRDADVGGKLSWMNGRLVFDNTELHNVLDELSRWYDVSFEYDRTMRTERISATFDNMHVADVARSIAVQLNATIERRPGMNVFHPRVH